MTWMNEDNLVQRTAAEFLYHTLHWDVKYAYNEETLGKEGMLGRESRQDVVLTRYLGEKLMKFNPGLPMEAYTQAIRQVVERNSTQSLLSFNKEKYALMKNGVQVSFRNDKGELVKKRLRLFDFETPENNHFLAVRELWVQGEVYLRRADIVCFVNGIPLLFMELKNVNKDIRAAYEKNFSDYKDTIPHLFHHNAFIIIANGVDAKIGSLSSQYEHFSEWKRLAEEEPGVVDMETMLKGVCDKRNFMDLFENFILFDDSSGKLIKIVARNHQFLGVNRAISSFQSRQLREGKLGVFWHTQGSGKSYSIAFFTQKIHRKIGGNFSFVVLTDRDDLDTQIYKTFAGCGLVNNDKNPCRPSNGEVLRSMLGEHKPYVFTLIQKFNQDLTPGQGYSQRNDIIVITDEAHRTQYGMLSINMRNALPNASYIGFTGTPLFTDDEITRRVFGDYISRYDFKRAVEDKATVPLYYDSRGEKLGVATDDLNEKIAKKIEELETQNVDVQERLERDLKRDYHIITAEKRLDKIAKDFVIHYSTSWETGKAMLVCIDKITCVRMYDLIQKHWGERIALLQQELEETGDEDRRQYLERQILWMRETLTAVVVSEEQGEVDKFKKWDLDIQPHRKLMKSGFSLHDGTRLDIDEAFKRDSHPFRIAIVCAMWLTGFDVPCLANLYLDKPLKAHTLMQAIARANRVNAGKNNGLIVDYCGILKNLRKALATFASGKGEAEKEEEPARPTEELLSSLSEAIAIVRNFLSDGGFPLEKVTESTGFARNAEIMKAKNIINENDITRKRFEIQAREVFKKFKACATNPKINEYVNDYSAINIIYKSLKEDREKADITDIIRQLHSIVDKAILPETPRQTEGEPVNSKPYDISQIDFDRLGKEFEKFQHKKTLVQDLKSQIEKKLARMLLQNPLRTDYQKHFEKIVEEYNKEKDRPTIEATFQELMQFMRELDKEEDRHIREELDEETLALYDLLKKTDLEKKDIDRVKKVATELLAKLKAEKLRIEHWQEKDSTKGAVFTTINDFLWDDITGLPNIYSHEDVDQKTHAVFEHVWRVYPKIPSPYYSMNNH